MSEALTNLARLHLFRPLKSITTLPYGFTELSALYPTIHLAGSQHDIAGQSTADRQTKAERALNLLSPPVSEQALFDQNSRHSGRMGTPQPSGPYNLPPGLTADSLDTLPILSSLLSRLQNPAAALTSGSPSAASPSQLAAGTGPLTIKDIPTATDGLKHKIQKARAQVKELPDMDRSIKDQEEEIRELEAKIARQREVLEGLRDVGLAMKRKREGRAGEGIGDTMET